MIDDYSAFGTSVLPPNGEVLSTQNWGRSAKIKPVLTRWHGVRCVTQSGLVQNTIRQKIAFGMIARHEANEP